MSRHWQPDGEETSLRGGKRGRSLDELDEWIVPHSQVPPAKRHKLSSGALAGLALVAAACAGTVVLLYRLAGPRDVFTP